MKNKMVCDTRPALIVLPMKINHKATFSEINKFIVLRQ